MIISSVIFVVFLVLVFSEKLQRTIAAVAGAAVMVVVGLIVGFYTEEQAVEAIDLHTIGLLLGMMLLVAMLQPTGFFEYVAIRAGRLSRGKIRPRKDDQRRRPIAPLLAKQPGEVQCVFG